MKYYSATKRNGVLAHATAHPDYRVAGRGGEGRKSGKKLFNG